MRGWRRQPVLLAGVAGIVTLLVGLAAPAAGHEGAAAIEVLGAEETAPLAVELEVAISYQIDQDPATPRTFTVQPLSPDGAELEAVPFDATGEEGRYRATVSLPEAGEWSLRLASTFPPGEVTLPVTVDGVPDTEIGPSEAPGTTAVPSEPTLVSSGEGGDPPWYLLAGVVVLSLLIAGVVVAAVVLRRRAGDETGND